MLTPTRWWLAVAPVDLRLGMDRLLLLARQGLQQDPRSGDGFVFVNRAGSRIKAVWMDGTGVWLCVRRLHEGRFVWPRADANSYVMRSEQLQWLLAGVQWQRLSSTPQALPSQL